MEVEIGDTRGHEPPIFTNILISSVPFSSLQSFPILLRDKSELMQGGVPVDIFIDAKAIDDP